MPRSGILCSLWALVALLCTSTAQAHFIFLLPETNSEGQTTVQIYFGEDASPDDPELLQRLTDVKAWQVTAGTPARELEVVRSPKELKLVPPGDASQAVFLVADDYGVISRGGAAFRLMYYAKSGPAANHTAWKEVDTSKQLALDVTPQWKDGELTLTVRFHGQPVAGAQVVTSTAEFEEERETNAQGQAAFSLKKTGLYSIRARHIEKQAGEVEGKAFADIRHYSTLALNVPGASAETSDVHLAAIPKMVTSFGGAVLGEAVYIYGGHSGGAHSYSHDEQGDTLLRLRLNDSNAAWESLAKGPALQGLAMVAHDGKLYRLGGFTAKNDAGEEHNLWSQNSVARFDPQAGEWQELPSLPEPRSSFDAAVLGDAIYVIGGWQLRGEQDSVWHPTAWRLDLSQKDLKWEALASPPFLRRALAVAAHRGKIYAIGGMQSEGGPCRRVDIYDPETGVWTQGPDILGEKGLAGFGCSAFEVGDALYVSTSEGKLQRLSRDGSAWEIARELPTARFFHRMLPAGENRLVMVGGANMGTGKFKEVELLEVPSAK